MSALDRISQIIGASKGIGLETTRQALEAGHHVRALARSAAGMALSDPNLEKVRGDALKSQDVEAALSGVDVALDWETCSGLCICSRTRPGCLSRR